MIAIAVDDEALMLGALTAAIEASMDISDISLMRLRSISISV